MSDYTRLPQDEIELDEKKLVSDEEPDPTRVSEKATQQAKGSQSLSREPELHRKFREDPRFNIPAVSPWKRFALLLFTAWLFWLAFTLRLNITEKKASSKVIYAERFVDTHLSRVRVQLIHA